MIFPEIRQPPLIAVGLRLGELCASHGNDAQDVGVGRVRIGVELEAEATDAVVHRVAGCVAGDGDGLDLAGAADEADLANRLRLGRVLHGGERDLRGIERVLCVSADAEGLAVDRVAEADVVTTRELLGEVVVVVARGEEHSGAEGSVVDAAKGGVELPR